MLISVLNLVNSDDSGCLSAASHESAACGEWQPRDSSRLDLRVLVRAGILPCHWPIPEMCFGHVRILEVRMIICPGMSGKRTRGVTAIAKSAISKIETV